MGSGIAQKIATEGLDVYLVDTSEEQVAKGLEKIRAMLDEGVKRKLFTPPQVEAILGRVQGTVDTAPLAGCELVIEAVFEDLGVKREVFARLAEQCPAEVLLATNTSSFQVAEVQRGQRHPERILGLHYFFHPAKNRLVEVIPGPETGEAELARARALQDRLGKTGIDSADAQGFVVNRYFVPWLNQGVRMLEKADIPTIDAAAREAFAIGMGPFALMNATGVPIALHAATTLGAAFGSFYAPDAKLAAQVEGGELWKLDGEPAGDAESRKALGFELLAAVLLAAGQLVDEGVGSVEDVDIGARVGLRWALGPFELWNRYGREAVLPAVATLAAEHGLELPRCLAEQEGSFTFRTVLETRPVPGLAVLTIRRPAALNALNPEVIAQLEEAFARVESDATVKTIALAGAGKAFVSGADIAFFVRNIDAGELGAIQEFTERGQALFSRFAASEKVVVALLDGISLGGGSELALACDWIVGTGRAMFGFPETGIGIYPGLGGTQRLTPRVGLGRAKELVLTGRRVLAEEAHAIGLLDELVRPEELVRAAVACGEKGKQRPAPAAAADPAAQAFAGVTAETVWDGPLDGLPEPVAGALAKVRQRKAKQAVIAACRLIDQGAAQGLEKGLALELAGLEAIFSTADAREGLGSVLERRRPQFKGE